MKRGQYILIGGAAVFAIGVIIATIGWSEYWDLPSKGNVFVEDWPLRVGESKTLSIQVTNITLAMNTLVIANDAVELNEVVTDPDGRSIVNLTFTKGKDMFFEPTVQGTYTLVVTNKGDSPTLVSAALRQPQPLTEIDINSIVTKLVSGILVAIPGVIVMIVGIVLIILDRRRKQAS